MEENVYNDSFVKLVKDRSIYSNKPILTPNDTAMVVADLISDYDREAIVVANFDSQNRPININIVGLGTINSAMMHPRELFKAVLLSNSASIMVFHNHPSGDPTPSQEDITVTNNLRKICNIMDINFLDHMVIGNDKIFSINENKVMDLGQEKLNYDLPAKESSFSLDLVSTRRIKDKEYYNNNISINSPEAAAALVADLSVDYKNDALTIAYVDNKLKPIKLSLVDNKLLESKQSYLKHIARNAILSNASSMIVFTSHFDGSILPNLRDNIVSQNNEELGKLINIDTVDHIIIGNNTYYSMKGNMELPKNNWNNVREARESYKTSPLTKVLDSRKELVGKIIDNLKNKQYIIDPSIYKHLTSPYNPTSEVRYSGANRFKLMFEAIAQDYKDSRWCTCKIDLDASAMYKHNIGYISSWIDKLSNDPNVFFRACSEANKISKYLVENYEKVQVQTKQIEQSKPTPSNNSDISNKLLDEVKKNGFKSSDKLVDAINKLSSSTEIKPTLKDISKEYKKLSKDLKAGILDKVNMKEYQKNIKKIGDILKDQEISKQQQQQKVNTNVLER
jgi:DNA repair protein RadC